MKILHFVSKMDRAGQETFIMNMYRSIDKEKFQFGFLCSLNEKGDYDDEIKSLGGKINYIKLSTQNSKLRHIKNIILMRDSLCELSSEYDILHIHNYHAFDSLLAVVAAKLAGFDKIVIHSHSDYADSHIKLHKIARFFLKRFKVIKLACSDSAGKWMFSNAKYYVIKNGIDSKKFEYNNEKRETLRKQMKLSKKFVIGHIGRFEPVKNHDFLIDLFYEYQKINQESVLLLVGRGTQQKAIEQKVTDLKIKDKVIFAGVRNDVNDIYQAMDLFIFPSKFEGLGIVAIEAQTSGLKCLVSEAIPKDIDVTENVERVSLQAPINLWISKINNAFLNKDNYTRKSYIDAVKEKGFDIYDSVKQLELIYEDKYDKI